VTRPSRGRDQDLVTPSLLLRAYACGIFPMADSATDPTLYWVEPRIRGVLPLDEFHLPRRLARTVRSDLFEVRLDTDFEAVISGCAAPRGGRQQDTWINEPIRRLYGELFRMGHVHTVEAWRDERMVGGLYGVKLGAAFFGESMFSTARDASKVALVHLVARLKAGGFRLLDVQFMTAHLSQFGAVEVPRDDYVRLLDEAVGLEADFVPAGAGRDVPPLSGATALAMLDDGSTGVAAR
jgi:leucyl/phenylalanyl-tRNA--protein transferase